MTKHLRRGRRIPLHEPDRNRPDGAPASAGEVGMTTAEYAVGTMAAVAFAVALLGVVRSDAVTSALTGIITTALSAAS
ncbi:DUF4244 domain-containing protein [Nostocoides sp. F2B08]|nr:DUF4244 domain-containing protein [Tetrasphaera sp. F2B08]KAB7746525.1 DUF4244 domain-containing protein [Tetrasphaera sp. F2B08]